MMMKGSQKMRVSFSTPKAINLRHAWMSGLALSAAILVLGGGSAQAAPPTSGAIMQATQPPPSLPPPPPAVLILPEPSAQSSNSSIEIPVSELVIEGNHLLTTGKLQALVQPAEGRRLTLGQLRGFLERINAAYQAAGYPLAYAYLPPQQVRNGVIVVKIVEPTYDQVQVRGNKRMRTSTVLRTLDVKPGQPVAEAALDRGLLLLNQTPGIAINGVLLPGSQPRTTTLEANVRDTDLVSGDIYTNNFGNRYTSANVVGLDLAVNDPFGYGSSMAVNGMIATGGDLQAGGFNVNSPYIWNGLRAGLYGSYTYYHLGGAFADLRQHGHANQIGADLTYPLLLEPGRALDVRFDVEQNGLGQTTFSTASAAQQTITLGRLTISGVESDGFHGVTTGSIALSQGNLTLSGPFAKLTDELGPKTAGTFQTALLVVQRQQSLPFGFTMTPGLTAQLASKNLDSSQQLYLGGPYGVMSYMAGEGGGDEGYLFDLRLSHVVPLPSRIVGVMQASALAETGSVWTNHNVYAGYTGRNRITENGLGGELDYDWNHFHAQLAYVYQIGPAEPVGVSTHSGQAWFQISYSF